MKHINKPMIQLILEISKVQASSGFLRKVVGLVGGSESFSKDCSSLEKNIFDSHNIRFIESETLRFYHENQSELLEYAVTCSDRLGCSSIVEMLIKEDQHNWATDFDMNTLAQALYDKSNTHHSRAANYFVRFSAQQAYTEYHKNIKDLKALFSEDFKSFIKDATSVHIDMIVYTAAIFGGTEEFIKGAPHGLQSHVSVSADDTRFSDKTLANMLALNKDRIMSYAENNAIWSGLFGQDHMIGCLLKEDDTTGYLNNISAKGIVRALHDNTDSNHEKVAGYLMRLLMQRICDYYNYQVSL